MALSFSNMVKGKPAGTVRPGGSLTSAVRGLGRPADVDLVRCVVRIQPRFATHGCDGHHLDVEKSRLLWTQGAPHSSVGACCQPLRLISGLQINRLYSGK